jgi:hypothetical protein
MKPMLTLLAASLFALPWCAGCASTPNEPIAGQGGAYTQYVMSLYDQPTETYAQRTIEFPVRIAVAQIGEESPDLGFIGALNSARDVVGQTAALPAPINCTATPSREPIRALQSMARDQGADYLLVYAATVQPQSYSSPLSALDLTIVGAFVVPSQQVTANARGSAALIDVRSGRVVLSAAAQASASRYSPDANASSELNRVSSEAHTKVFKLLADNFVRTARDRAASQEAQSASASTADISARQGAR